MSKTVLILGATSSIARAIAHRLAAGKHNLILAGRDLDELSRVAADLRLRHGVPVATREFDALAFYAHPAFFEACTREFPNGLDGVILCYGYLGSQVEAQRNFAEVRTIIDVNYTSCVSVLNMAADYLEPRQCGFICAISSVAGDRGRRSHYIYGSAKAALSTYLQGLRHRLAKVDVPVITVKPGFVDTQMTFGHTGLFLVAGTDAVARDIIRAIEKRKDVVYVPWFWWGIMAVIKSIPERIFKRRNL